MRNDDNTCILIISYQSELGPIRGNRIDKSLSGTPLNRREVLLKLFRRLRMVLRKGRGVFLANIKPKLPAQRRATQYSCCEYDRITVPIRQLVQSQPNSVKLKAQKYWTRLRLL